MSEESTPKKKATRKNKAISPKKPEEKQTVVAQITPKVVEEIAQYKCLECGNVQQEKRCGRCSGGLLRKV